MAKHLTDSTVIYVEGKALPFNDLTFSDIRCRYKTGRSIVSKGIGQCVRYTYRCGIMTKIGDIEEKEWVALVERMIERDGEQELFNQLREWYKKECKWADYNYVLECFAARIFDNRDWCDFVAFNTKYRPEALTCAAAGTV